MEHSTNARVSGNSLWHGARKTLSERWQGLARKALGSPSLREALLVEVEKHPNLKAHPGPQTIYLQWRIA
jgi:hypothetical protein